jgi:hypothetical protein
MPLVLPKSPWLLVLGMIATPVVVLTAGTLIEWPPASRFSQVSLPAFLVLSLVAGLPFALGIARRWRSWGIVVIIAYLVIGVLVLRWLPLAINCGGRGICP